MQVMSVKNHDSRLRYIEENFNITFASIRKIMKDFHSEMTKGLRQKKSSLKMIPTYVDNPSGSERGRFIALDLGGTNFRILLLELKGKGKIIKLAEEKFVLEKKYTTGSARGLFDFIAGCIKDFIDKQDSRLAQGLNIGFTFSFPVKQTAIACGKLLHWTKGFSVSGVVGKDVVNLLNDSLAGKGMRNVKVAALLNDTVGTLAACGYKHKQCDIGIILGTGTNACYREKISNIYGPKVPKRKAGQMIINIEWGNFDKLKSTVYDKILDKNSHNPGQHILEKMVSGMYLGELAAIIINGLTKENIAIKDFKTEYMSQVEGDSTADLSGINALLKKSGIVKSSLAQRLLVKKICKLVSQRAASLSAAALAAVITRIDPALCGKHIVAVDGTVYKKYPGFSRNMKFVLGRIFGKKSHNIKLALTEDGSGIGAAVIAAVASGESYA